MEEVEAIYSKVINAKGNPMYYVGEGKTKRLTKRDNIPDQQLLDWGETIEHDGVEEFNEPDEEGDNPMDQVGESETVDVEDEDDPDLEIVPQGDPVVELPKECIFCGIDSTRQKFVNMIKVPLCNEHWLEKTTGEIAKQLGEKGI